jgi:hypothetical protein
MLIVGLSQAIFVPSAAQLHLSFSSPHSERLVGSFSLSHFDRRTELPERLSMPLLILPSHVALPIARAVQIGLPVRAPRSGCCHYVGSAGSSRLRTGTTGRAVVESSGLCSVIRLFGMPIAARAVPAGAQCDVLATAMACSSMLRSGRPIPGLPRSSWPGAHFCVEIPRPVATELAPPGGCTGPLAADLSNRTRRAVGAKDARTTRTPPWLRRGQL